MQDAAIKQQQATAYQEAINRMVLTAAEAGCPPDQIRNFLSNGYAPTPQQWKFHAACRSADYEDGPVDIAMGGARGGAKSHAIMAQVALDDCQRFAGLDVLYLRLIQKAGRKALDQLRKKTIMSLRHTYNRNEGTITFANGSTIVVGHFKNEGDIDKYIGIEYDIIIIEERTQLSQEKIDQLMGSRRTGKPGWRPRSYNASNPGGIGHADFRDFFVIPERENRQTENQTCYIMMDWRHNPFINQEYKQYLMNLTGILGEMWRDGNWDIGSGTYFINWLEKVHVIKPLDRCPLEWPLWISMDWGWTHPATFQWHTQRPDGDILTISEFKIQRKLVAELVPTVEKITRGWDRSIGDVSGFVAGHDIYTKRGASELSIAQQFIKEGITWEPAKIDRINGAAQLTKRLGNPRENIPATWFITSSCEGLVRAMPNMIIDEKRPEDVLKINANEFGEGGDDSYDCARYGLMVVPMNLSAGGFASRY